MEFWRFQSTITALFSTYLFLLPGQSPLSPWNSLWILIGTLVVVVSLSAFGTPEFTTDIAAVAVAHFLFTNLALNWLLTTVLILSALPMMAYHVLLALRGGYNNIIAWPRLRCWQYIYIVNKYMFCIRGLYLHWEDEETLELHGFRVGILMLLISIYCLTLKWRVEHLRQAQIARGVGV